MTKPTQRICIDCAYCTAHQFDRRNAPTRYLCNASRHPIDGRIIVLECETMRHKRVGKCGPAGKLWAPANARKEAAE